MRRTGEWKTRIGKKTRNKNKRKKKHKLINIEGKIFYHSTIVSLSVKCVFTFEFPRSLDTCLIRFVCDNK